LALFWCDRTARLIDDCLRHAKPARDLERVAAAGEPDREVVRRRKRLDVELDRGVRHAVGCVRERLALPVVRRSDRQGADVEQP
jgi:hypothetical protein